MKKVKNFCLFNIPILLKRHSTKNSKNQTETKPINKQKLEFLQTSYLVTSLLKFPIRVTEYRY